MKYQVTMYLILKVLKGADAMYSAKGIADHGNIDNTSENLLKIRDECFDLVEAGEAVYRVVDKTPFFMLNSIYFRTSDVASLFCVE